MYRERTRDIEINVTPNYIEDQSRPDEGYFFFSYKVVIKNVGHRKTKLVSRRWLITDGRGHTEEVEGPGVVGQQPEIEAGQEYEYTSFCPLPTPTGNMRGTYHMVDENGERYDVTIPLFFLRPMNQSLH